IEGLLSPGYWAIGKYGSDNKRSRSWLGNANESFVAKLKRHATTILSDPERRNVFPDGGLKLSSTSNNSWLSKIALFQYVAREVFNLGEDPRIGELLRASDAAHVTWQIEGAGRWGCTDQFVSGQAHGSRGYPRGITTTLWLDKVRS